MNKHDDKSKPDNLKAKSSANSKTNMRKRAIKTREIFSWALALVITGLFGTLLYINSNKQAREVSQLKSEKTELRRAVNNREALIDDMVSTFNEIEADLKEISKREQVIEVETGAVENTKTKKAQIIDEIKYVNTLLEENKKKIDYLSNRLKESGVQIASLEEKIKQLEQSVLNRDSSITALKLMLEEKNYQMAQMNQKMDTMRTVIHKQKEVIDYQNNELNIAYLTKGNYTELEKKGILTKEKGFWIFGNDKVIPEEFSKEFFQEVKISETKIIPIQAKKAEIITNHPKNSYVFVKDSTEGLAYLEIKDPGAFWKISKYAVIETK